MARNTDLCAVSEEELGSFEPPTEVEIVLQNDEFTTKECIKACFKPTYQMRRLKNKGAILILIWSFLLMWAYYYIKTSIIIESYCKLCLYVIQIPIALVLPFAGWLADVRFGRFRVIYWSVWTMWISALLLTVSSIVTQLVESYKNSQQYVQVALLAFLSIGYAGHQANIIQFGVDQLIDASTTEIISFIYWYTWVIASSGVVRWLITCTCTQYNCKLVVSLLMCMSINIVLCLMFLYKNSFIKEPVTQNPFKLIYKVIKYAIKNRRPRLRSAFTYCEDELPSRIDFGMSKYGGPFTTEQVEDVKTFFRMISIVLITSAAFGLTDEPSFSARFRKRVTEKTPRECSYTLILVHNFYITGALLILLNETFIYPLFHRCLPSIKCYWKIVLGILLSLGRYIALVILVTVAKRHYLQTNGPFYNSTVQCLSHGDAVDLSNTLNYR